MGLSIRMWERDSGTRPGAVLRGHPHQGQGLRSHSSDSSGLGDIAQGEVCAASWEQGTRLGCPRPSDSLLHHLGNWKIQGPCPCFLGNYTPHITPWWPEKPVTFHRGQDPASPEPTPVFFSINLLIHFMFVLCSFVSLSTDGVDLLYTFRLFICISSDFFPTIGYYKIMNIKLPVCYAQPYLTLCNPVDCSPPGFSVLRISQAKALEWVVISIVPSAIQ